MASSHGGPARAAAIRTFLIADVRGYTRFTAQHGDEAASRLATRFAEVAGEGVEAWGGELVELRGDEALAVFDSARQALRAAVELQSAFADETASEPALPLGVGIGLDVGEAVPVGDGYRGGALNLAARMCAVAGPGEVLASEGLVRLAGHVDGLEYSPLEPTTFKGYDEPIAAVRVSGSDGLWSAAGAEPQPSGQEPPTLPPELDPIVPLAGRESELRWLSWHWRRARHGHGRTLVLSGPPGIGKTRLAAELATNAHAAGAAVVYLPAPRGTDDARVEALPGLPGPALVIVDDIDAAGTTMAREAERLADGLAGRPGLLLVTHRREAPPAVVALAERLAPPEQRRQLGPLEPDAVRAIAALYAGRGVEDLPLGDLVARSGGVPAAVHQVASQWARTAASHRLEASADRTGAGRRTLREAEEAMIEDVADLESTRERARLYAVDRADEGDRARAGTICPYKGLAAFEAADADYYFGRERLVAELTARFVGSTFLGLVGDSGSGKSSALLAGLLPALAGGVLPGSERWPQAVMRPGEHPLAELGRALARALPDRALPAGDPSAALDAALATLAPGQRLVIVVDQFEEVFNATRDDAERSAFIDVLTGERPGLKVIVAIRADHYGRCAAYPALARLIGADHVLVGPLSAVELAAVVEHPAQRVGLRVEPGLTEALVADAGSEPGILSLLSTALLELWQAREKGRLTFAAYQASGGLRGAIARLAETAYAQLDPHRQAVARAILLRLAGPGEGAELVRRRVPLAELDADRDPAVAEVLETLTSARLLTSGDGSVEVAHEALLREWPRLQGWLEEDAAGRQVRLHLIGAVRDWEQRGREPGDLYRGARLAAALDWAADHGVEINATERTFLDESREASEHEAERQRRMNRRLRALLAGAAVLLVVAVGAGGFAAVQGQRATDEARRAEQQRLEADKQRVAAEQARDAAVQAERRARSGELTASAVAALAVDPSLSKLLALEATTVVDQPTDQTTSVLHKVLAADPVIARYSWPKDRLPVGVGPTGDFLLTDLDPAGRLLVASGQFHLEVADARSGTVLWAYDAELGAVIGRPAYFSADGTQVIAGLFWDPQVRLPGQPDVEPPTSALGVFIWDAHTGKLQKRIDLGPCGGQVAAVSEGHLLVYPPLPGPDGRTGCHWPEDGKSVVEVVDPITGTSKRLSDRAIMGSGGTLSGNGRFAAFDVFGPGTCGPSCFTSLVVNVATRKRVFELEPPPDYTGTPFAETLNHDGTLLLYGDRPTLVFDIAHPLSPARPTAQFPGLGGGSGWAVFDPTGESVYETETNGTLSRWDPITGDVLATWRAVGSGRPSIAADGRTVLVSNVLSPTAVLLDSGARGDLGQVQTCRGSVSAGSLRVRKGLAVFMEDCDAPGGGGLAQVVDLQDRKVVASLPVLDTQDLAISPDGRSFVSQEFLKGSNLDGPLQVVDLRTGSVVVELQGLCRYNETPGTAPPDKQDGCKTFPQTPFPFWTQSVQWSPDGAMIAAVNGGGYPGYLAVWDAHDGRLIHTAPYDPDHSALQVIFTPDSKRLLVSQFETGLVETLSTETWKPVATTRPDPAGGVEGLGFAGFTPDGSTLLAVNLLVRGGKPLLWLDGDTLQMKKTVPDAYTPWAKSTALSPDGSLVAIGASDGILRVWDTQTGELRQQMEFGSPVQGVAFIDNKHLAVTPEPGDLLIMTVDPAELADTVRASLTRSFTATECKTYGIDPCPTLEEMRTP